VGDGPVPDGGGPGGLVASFGVVNQSKDLRLLLEAFAPVFRDRPGTRLALVGHASAQDREMVAGQAQRLGIAAAVTVTGGVDDAAWDRWLREATVAVQLRRQTNGEFSAAVAECLAVGVPTIVTAAGSAGDLPGTAVPAGRTVLTMTGLDGTPMPSFADNIKPDEAWDLVFYLRTFMRQPSKEKAIAKQLGLKPVDPNAPAGQQ